MTYKIVALLVVVLLGALVPERALAQEAEPNPSPQQKETARRLLDQGRAAEAKGDLTTAIPLYRGAHAIMGVPTTGIYLATALAKSGKLIEARDVALQSSRAPKLKNERPERARARDDSAKLVVELGPRIPSITVVVEPKDIAGLSVGIDGQTLPPSVHSLPWAVDPGDHIVKAAAAGQVEQTLTVRAPEGQKQIVTFRFVVAQGPPPVLPPAQAPPPVRPTRSRGPGPLVIAGAVGLSVGGALLVAGAVTGGLSLAQTNDLKASCDGTSCPASLQGDADGAQQLATASNATLAVGGALAAAGAITLGIGIARQDRRAPRMGLSVGLGRVVFGGEL